MVINLQAILQGQKEGRCSWRDRIEQTQESKRSGKTDVSVKKWWTCCLWLGLDPTHMVTVCQKSVLWIKGFTRSWKLESIKVFDEFQMRQKQ